jgi:hypothetical protein
VQGPIGAAGTVARWIGRGGSGSGATAVAGAIAARDDPRALLLPRWFCATRGQLGVSTTGSAGATFVGTTFTAGPGCATRRSAVRSAAST